MTDDNSDNNLVDITDDLNEFEDEFYGREAPTPKNDDVDDEQEPDNLGDDDNNPPATDEDDDAPEPAPKKKTITAKQWREHLAAKEAEKVVLDEDAPAADTAKAQPSSASTGASADSSPTANSPGF